MRGHGYGDLARGCAQRRASGVMEMTNGEGGSQRLLGNRLEALRPQAAGTVAIGKVIQQLLVGRPARNQDPGPVVRYHHRLVFAGCPERWGNEKLRSAWGHEVVKCNPAVVGR